MKNPDLQFISVPPFSATDPGMPPRTRLFSLPPIGVGTASAEGLLSYVIRLAAAHSVSPRRLIINEFTKVCPSLAQYRRHGTFFETAARSINGLHHYSALFARIVKTLCGLSEAKHLTLRSLRPLLPFNGAGLTAPSPRWCPACYDEMNQIGQETYQPLVWSFDLYRACSKHGTAMADRCPLCGKRQYVIPRTPTIGYCSHCGTWLGRRSDASSPMTKFDLWTSVALEEIVAELPRLQGVIRRKQFISRIKQAIRYFAEGNTNRFCREMGLSRHKLDNVRCRNVRPTLPLWLEISYGINTGPVGFLKADLAVIATKSALRKLPTQLKQRAPSSPLTEAEFETVEKVLGAMVEAGDGDISVSALAARYQITPSQIRYRWPHLCRRISRQFKDRVNYLAKDGLAEKRKVIREVVKDLLKHGEYPSQKAVQHALDRTGISMADPAVREAYRQQLKNSVENKDRHAATVLRR